MARRGPRPPPRRSPRRRSRTAGRSISLCRPISVGAIEPVGITNAWASNPRTTRARMKATTIASTVSRWPSSGAASASFGLPRRGWLQCSRQSVPSSVLLCSCPDCRDGRRSHHVRFPRRSCRCMLDVPRPAFRALIECNGFAGDREPSKPTARRPRAATTWPGRWTRNGLPRNIEPRHDRALGPEPRVVRDRAVVAQHEVLVRPERIGRRHAVRMARVSPACWCSRCRG